MELIDCIVRLERAGVDIAPGLTAAEVRATETTYDFRFPPDLRAFLMAGLPISHTVIGMDGKSRTHQFVDWRGATHEHILDRLVRPLEGMCFDIEHNAFWLDAWGERPADGAVACARARQAVAAAPRLIPIYSHRYIPATPHEHDNPVFSVYQTDIIHYGRSLVDYLANEFRSAFNRSKHEYNEPCKHIEFWSNLVGLERTVPRLIVGNW